MPDIELTCSQCGNDFYWNEKDQAFYARQGFQPPKRCWNCRQARKAERVEIGQTGIERDNRSKRRGP